MPALIATISGNAVPLQRTLKDVENAARRAGMVVQKNLSNASEIKTGAMREFLVLLREIGRGNWNRVPGSASILAQQFDLLKYLLHPVTIGIVALGAAAWFTAKRILGLREAHRNLAEIMDWTRIKLSTHADAMREAAERAADLHNWIRHLGEAEETLGKKTMETLKAMKEKARMERENAHGRGAKEKDLEKMDLKEAEKELMVVVSAKLAAGRALELDKLQEPLLRKMLASANRAEAIKSIQERRGEMGKAADAIQEKMRNSTFAKYGTVEGNYGVPITVYEGQRKGNANDVFDVEVAGKKFHMSLNQARKNLDGLNKREIELEKAERDLKDVVERKKRLGERDASSFRQLTEQEAEIKEHIANLKNQIKLPATGSLSVHLSSNQREGAFVAFHAGNDRLAKTAEKIEQHVATLVAHSQNPNQNAPKFPSRGERY